MAKLERRLDQFVLRQEESFAVIKEKEVGGGHDQWVFTRTCTVDELFMGITVHELFLGIAVHGYCCS